MKILELYAGSRSIGKVAEKLGYKVFSSDIEQFGEIDYVVDILEFDYKKVPFVPDVIWASPPCTGFSVASIGTHWGGGYRGYEPKTNTAKLGIKLVEKTLEIIEHYKKLNPNLIWYMENPRGVLRKLDIVKDLPIRQSVTYCQYGDERMKPTDIWTNNKNWNPKPMCKNGMKCHISAPRGSKTGTQGRKGAYERSKIPPALCREILLEELNKM
jgi:site-specific DNA-cytosine methylase